MSELTPLASALHSKIWPLIATRVSERCETIDEENAMMNIEVPRLAPLLVQTPREILANIWGVHPDEADLWVREIVDALRVYGP